MASVRRIIDALADGLGALHGVGVVHRDIKPGNLLIVVDDTRGSSKQASTATLLIAPGERIVVGDLGLAKDQQRSSIGPTMLGGTPLYVAPEQCEIGAPVSPASDVYSATAVVWHVLTGEPPPAPEQLSVRLVGIEAELRGFLSRGMAREPEDRYQTMTEWRRSALLALGLPAAAPDATGYAYDLPPVDARTSIRLATATTAICPYKGLAAFQTDDAPLFFGRLGIVDELLSRR